MKDLDMTATILACRRRAGNTDDIPAWIIKAVAPYPLPVTMVRKAELIGQPVEPGTCETCGETTGNQDKKCRQCVDWIIRVIADQKARFYGREMGENWLSHNGDGLG